MWRKFLPDTLFSKQQRVWYENQFCMFNLSNMMLNGTFQREERNQGVAFSS